MNAAESGAAPDAHPDRTLQVDARPSITGYRYRQSVGELLIDAERNGALTDGSWLGGTELIESFRASGYLQQNHGSGSACTRLLEDLLRDYVGDLAANGASAMNEAQRATVAALVEETAGTGWVTLETRAQGRVAPCTERGR